MTKPRKPAKRPSAPTRGRGMPRVPTMTPQEKANLAAVLRHANSSVRTPSLPRAKSAQPLSNATTQAPREGVAKPASSPLPATQKVSPRAPSRSAAPNPSSSDSRKVLLEQLQQIQQAIRNHPHSSSRLPPQKREPNRRAMIASRNQLIAAYLKLFPKHEKDMDAFREE